MKYKITLLYIGILVLMIFQILASAIWNISFWGVFPEFVLLWIWVFFSVVMIIVFRKILTSKIAIGVFIFFIVLNLFTKGIPALLVFREISPSQFYFHQKVSPTLRFEMNEVILSSPILKAYERRFYFFEKRN